MPSSGRARAQFILFQKKTSPSRTSCPARSRAVLFAVRCSLFARRALGKTSMRESGPERLRGRRERPHSGKLRCAFHVPIWQENTTTLQTRKARKHRRVAAKIFAAHYWRDVNPALGARKASRREMLTITMLQSNAAGSTRYAVEFLPSLRELLAPGFRRVMRTD